MNTKYFKKTIQAGFTLVELIIVIVIVGILAAVAIPKLSDTSSAAYAGVATATLGALKSAWSSAYAINKGILPTTAQVAGQMDDPKCPLANLTLTSIKCDGISRDGTTTNLYVFNTTLDANGKIASPSDIVMVP